jgi:hypothetical protein
MAKIFLSFQPISSPNPVTFEFKFHANYFFFVKSKILFSFVLSTYSTFLKVLFIILFYFFHVSFVNSLFADLRAPSSTYLLYLFILSLIRLVIYENLELHKHALLKRLTSIEIAIILIYFWVLFLNINYSGSIDFPIIAISKKIVFKNFLFSKS